jgi:hypothetical protein
MDVSTLATTVSKSHPSRGFSPNKRARIIGHAGALLQARKLGKELVVGIHSDEAILENKGPTVMTLQERLV